MALTHEEWEETRKRLRPGRQASALAYLSDKYPTIQFKIIAEFPDYVCSEYGDIYYTKRPEKALKFGTKDGYLRLALSFKGKRPTRKIHRLVADCFLPPKPPDCDQINHIDGCKTNNHYTNLEWCDAMYNTSHAWSMGLVTTVKGSTHYAAKLDETQAAAIKSLKGEIRGCDLATYFKISRSVVSSIQSGVAWKQVKV